jgi:vancomycin resistance protein YoaR
VTTRSDPYLIPYAKPATSGTRWRRATFTFVLTLVAMVVFAASFAVGYARMHEGRVLPGVEVAGVSLAGLSRAQSAAELSQSLPSLGSGNLVIDVDGVEQQVAYSSFEREYDLQFMLDQAFSVGRGPNFVEQLQEQLRILVNGVDVEPVVTWDNEALVEQVAAFAMAAQTDPVDATLQRVDGRYAVSPSSEGMSVDVEGAVTDAIAAINNTSPANTSITVRTSTVPPTITTAQVQSAVDTVERVVSSGLVVSGAELTTEITSDALRGWVHLNETAPGEWQVVIEREPVRQFVENYAIQTDIPAQNATFRFAGGTDFEVVPSADGRAADIDSTTDGIMAALEARVTGGQAPPTANLALVTVPPTFTTDDARAISSSVTKIGEWTTNFSPSELNGNGANISIPTSIIDGYVVEPGAVFNFLDVIGPITSPPYTAGAAIVNGRTREGVLGGGMCSCSTTLFNAAARAGLEIRNRRNHSYYITRYPVGLDATVWIASARSRQTMSFMNDLQYPVLIRGINASGVVTFELYGVPDGRTTEFSEPVVTNEETAQDFYQYTNDLAPGQRDRIEYAVDGFDAVVTRTVRDQQGNVIHEDTFKSHYKTITGTVLVGRYPGDPPAGRRVTAEQWRATHGGGGGGEV